MSLAEQGQPISGRIGTPVFLCGFAKSGTTLLLSLLDRHPDLLVFPEESKFLKNILGHPERRSLDYVLTETGANAFRDEQPEQPSGNRDYQDVPFDLFRRTMSRFWEEEGRSEEGLLEAAVRAYADVTQQNERKFWIEKTPGNELHLSKALTLWPDLLAICIVRDPRDNYASLRRKRWKDNRDLPPQQFAKDWRRSIGAWEAFAAGGHRHLTIRYEDLVEATESTLGRVCEFLGIRWNDILLEPTLNGRPWSGNSMYGTRFVNVSTLSHGRYTEELSVAEILNLERQTLDAIARYGWPRLGLRKALRIKAANSLRRMFGTRKSSG